MHEEEIHFRKLLPKQFEMFLPHLTTETLTFDPVTLKSIGRMCGRSLRKVGQGVLKLLIGNEKVTDEQTDGQTDRPTCTKQYSLSSSKGSIKKRRKCSNKRDFWLEVFRFMSA